MRPIGGIADACRDILWGSSIDEELRATLRDKLCRVRSMNGRSRFVSVLLEPKSRSDPDAALQIAVGCQRWCWRGLIAGARHTGFTQGRRRRGGIAEGGWSVAADARTQRDRYRPKAKNRSPAPQAEAILVTVPGLGPHLPDKPPETPTRSMPARRASSDTQPCAAATFRNALMSSRGPPSNSSIAAFSYAAMSCGLLR